MKNNRCYMCNAISTSREHVPPLCLFPEKKDVPFANLRKDLITVPSCYLHNSKKSKDDEFLLATLAGMVGNNSVAFIHNRTKVKRMFERYGDHFIEVISKNPKFFNFKSKSGNIFPVVVGHPDVPRLLNCFRHIAYGIYYYEFKKNFTGKCHVIPAFLNYNNENMRSYMEVIERRYIFHEKDKETIERGNNPLVFQHWMINEDDNGLIGMKMTFYEGADVYVCFEPEHSDIGSTSLIKALIDAGANVHVGFPDGKSPVQFNKDNKV